MNLAADQTTMSAAEVEPGAFVYDYASALWVEVVGAVTEHGTTRLTVIADHEVPIEYRAGEMIAVCFGLAFPT